MEDYELIFWESIKLNDQIDIDRGWYGEKPKKEGNIIKLINKSNNNKKRSITHLDAKRRYCFVFVLSLLLVLLCAATATAAAVSSSPSTRISLLLQFDIVIVDDDDDDVDDGR